MRLMERIRTRMRVFFLTFAIIFVVSVFAGLGVGFFGTSMRRSTSTATGAEYRTLVPGVSAVASIDGEDIDILTFDKRLQLLRQQMRDQTSISRDPFQQNKLLSDTLDDLFTEYTLIKYAREHNLGVSDGEVREEIDRRLEVAYPSQTTDEPSGSVLGELGRRFKSSTEREKALNDYVQTLGTRLPILKQEIHRELLSKKALDHISELEKSKKEADAQERIEKIQAALEGGEDFGDLAEKYSDDKGTRDKGGLLDQMIPRGFFDAAFDAVVYDMNVGDISEPIKTEFGYQIVKLIDKKAAEGPEWEAAKPGLIEKIRQQRGETYEPTDEELKALYEEVKVQHITLQTIADRETYGRIYWMTFAADRRIYDPMILAWRAVNTEPLCFPELQDTTMEQIARDSLLETGADLSDLAEKAHEFQRVKLLRYQRAYGDPPEELRPRFAEFNLEYDVEIDSAKPPDYPELDKLYPLAAGLVKQAIKLNDSIANYHYSLAAVYDGWLDSSKAREMFPIDAEAARAEIENELNTCLKLYEFDGYYYALAGKNYAKWVKPDDAREMLFKAEKYAPGDIDLLKMLTSAYRVNGDTEKADEFQEAIIEEQRKRGGQQGGWVKVD